MKTRLQKYLLIIVGVLVWSALLIGLNFLAKAFNVRWDVTAAHQHTLNNETIDLLKGLKKDIKVVAFYVGLPPQYLEDMLKEYEHYSQGRVKTEIVDPIVQISYAAQFGNTINGQEKKVIVQSGGERKDVDFSDEEPLSEELLNHAFVQVTRKARHAYFLSGHEEYDLFGEDEKGLNKLSKLLLANNIVPKKLVLGIEGKIPEDCDLLIVAGPHNPLPANEEQLIREYLDKGGDAFFLVENTPVTTPDKPLTEEELKKNPSLNNIFKDWGIKISDDVVVDLESHASTDVGCPATKNYMTHRAIVKGLDYTFYVRPRSISVLKDRRNTIKVAPLVLTMSSEQSWGETDRTLKVKFDEGIDRAGPVPFAFVIWESRKDIPAKKSDTKIIVFTDVDFLSNAFIDLYSNAQMGINVINWLTDLDYPVVMTPKEKKIARLDLASGQKRMVVIILVLMPLLIILWGFAAWLRYRD